MVDTAPLRDTSRPIPDRHLGPPRNAESIIESITNEALKRQAISYFGCFHLQGKHGTPCTSCCSYRLSVLHCLDSWEECFCPCACNGYEPENHICEDYPDDDNGELPLDE